MTKEFSPIWGLFRGTVFLAMGPLVCAALGGEDPLPLAKVVITPSALNITETGPATRTTLTSADLQWVPQMGDDLFRSINRLPGLAADDFAAKFWMRGAPNSEVLIRFDGAELIEPYHIKDYDGAVSIVDLQTVQSVEMITGGFAADFGNRLTGVMAIETKSAPAGAEVTRVGINLLNLSLSHAGSFDAGRGRWLASLRQGLPDVALRSVNEGQKISPRYHDFSGKLEYQLAPNHELSLHVLYAADRMKLQQTGDPELRSYTSNTFVWGRWRGAFGDEVTGEGVVSVANLHWERDGSGLLGNGPFLLRDQRELTVYSAHQDWQLSLNDHALVRAGFEGSVGTSSYRYLMERQIRYFENGVLFWRPERIDTALDPRAARAGAYAALRWQPVESLTLEPSLRFDRQDNTDDSDLSPRFNAAWAVGGGTFRAAWGIYYQSQALQELNVSDHDRLFRKAERAQQRVLSFEHALSKGLLFRIEGYERASARLRPRWVNLNDPYNAFPEVQSDRIRLTPSSGRARGVEFLLRGKPTRNLTWNASYALARSEENVSGKWIPRARDQRHTVQLDMTYSPTPHWQFSAAWQYHTGWPTTESSFQLLRLADGSLAIVGSNGAPFSVKLPDYHRLDLRVTRTFTVRHGQLATYLDVFNAYNRSNLIGYDQSFTVTGSTLTVTNRPRKLFPLLPTAGVSWEF